MRCRYCEVARKQSVAPAGVSLACKARLSAIPYRQKAREAVEAFLHLWNDTIAVGVGALALVVSVAAHLGCKKFGNVLSWPAVSIAVPPLQKTYGRARTGIFVRWRRRGNDHQPGASRGRSVAGDDAHLGDVSIIQQLSRSGTFSPPSVAVVDNRFARGFRGCLKSTGNPTLFSSSRRTPEGLREAAMIQLLENGSAKSSSPACHPRRDI